MFLAGQSLLVGRDSGRGEACTFDDLPDAAFVHRLDHFLRGLDFVGELVDFRGIERVVRPFGGPLALFAKAADVAPDVRVEGLAQML